MGSCFVSFCFVLFIFQFDYVDAVTICLIDSGIDTLKYPMFKRGVSIFDGKLTQEFNDSLGHGTGMFEIILNNTVINNLNLIICKFIHSYGFGDVLDAIKCIQYCVENKVDIINASWEGSGHFVLSNFLLESIKQNKIIFVSVAGNNHINIDISQKFPSKYSNKMYNIYSDYFITVTGIKIDNYGYGHNTVQLLAPDVWNASFKIGFLGYFTLSGTSVSAAYTTGKIYNLLKRGIPPMCIKNYLINSSLHVENITDNLTSGGII